MKVTAKTITDEQILALYLEPVTDGISHAYPVDTPSKELGND